MPSVLTLDRVWITADGRVKLLDFSPGLASQADAAQSSITPGVFLNQVAISSLEGRMATIGEASSHSVKAPLPLKARAFLNDLIAPAATGFSEKLLPLLREATRVAWWKRLAMVLVPLAPCVFITLFMIGGQHLFQRIKDTNPDFTPFLVALTTHEELTKGRTFGPKENFNTAEVKAALEVHIAGRYGDFIRSGPWDTSPFYRSVFRPALRTAAERIVKEHPQPSEAEMQHAQEVLKPHLSGVIDPKKVEKDMSDMPKVMNSITSIMVTSFLTCFAILSLVCALIFRRGPLFRILGIDVVTRDGAEASRLRMLGRNLIAWSPTLFLVFMVWLVGRRGIRPDDDSFMSVMLSLGILVAALVIGSLSQKERGLQDQFAGTWLVPH